MLCLSREGNRIKLIDFGMARRYDPTKKLQILFGTAEFVGMHLCIVYTHLNFIHPIIHTDLNDTNCLIFFFLIGIIKFLTKISTYVYL